MTVHPRVEQWQSILAAAVEKANEHRARDDAFVAMSRELTDPVEYARYVPLSTAKALRHSYRTREGYRCSATVQGALAREGLADIRLCYLTAFGIAVRRAILREMGL